MVGNPWRALVLLLVPVAAVAGLAGVTGLAGCDSGAGHASGGGGATRTAGMAAQTGPFTAVRLRGALLTKVNGVAAAAPAQDGSYASLAAVKAASQQARGGSVTPSACARMTLTGLDSAVLASTAAAAVTFRVGANDVSEVLAAAPSAVASSAFAGQVAARCGHYEATAGGTRVRYTATEAAVTGIGMQARVLEVRTAGKRANDTWSMVYRGKGFVGAVTVTGPNASEAAVRELGQQAYAYAAYTLS